MVEGVTAKKHLLGDKTIVFGFGPTRSRVSSFQFWAVGISQEFRVSIVPGLTWFVARACCSAGFAGMGEGTGSCDAREGEGEGEGEVEKGMFGVGRGVEEGRGEEEGEDGVGFCIAWPDQGRGVLAGVPRKTSGGRRGGAGGGGVVGGMPRGAGEGAGAGAVCGTGGGLQSVIIQRNNLEAAGVSQGTRTTQCGLVQI